MHSDTIILDQVLSRLRSFLKILAYVPNEREKVSAKKWALICQLNVVMAHRNYFRRNYLRILKLATHRKIAKDGPMFIFYFVYLSKQSIKCYGYVMKIKNFVLPIWCFTDMEWIKNKLLIFWDLHSEWVNNMLEMMWIILKTGLNPEWINVFIAFAPANTSCFPKQLLGCTPISLNYVKFICTDIYFIQFLGDRIYFDHLFSDWTSCADSSRPKYRAREIVIKKKFQSRH